MAAAGMLEFVQAAIRHNVEEAHRRLRWGTPEAKMIVYPVVVYWTVACFYGLLDRLRLPLTERWKVVRREEKGRPNPIDVPFVIKRVLLQHAIQVAFNIGFVYADPHACDADSSVRLVAKGARFVVGMFVMDTWQYWIHRWAHTNTWLYKHVHSVHHQLNHVYAYGALYNSPVEALLLDVLGGLVTFLAASLTCDTATLLFCFATCKTVLDHCGYRFPINPLHDLFPNSSAYHDVHHDTRYIKRNFSQPFFTHWDWLLGTFMDPADVHLQPAEVAANVKAGLTLDGKKKTESKKQK